MRSGNLGHTGLQRKSRDADPMQTFDSLPPELRLWLNSAVLPWSPHSCAAIWRHARKDGLSLAETLERLSRSEARTLRRNGRAMAQGRADPKNR